MWNTHIPCDPTPVAVWFIGNVVKDDIALPGGNPTSELRDVLGMTQCYLSSDTSEPAPPNPSRAGRYSIYLPRRDGRLSWPSRLDSAQPESRTSDLSWSITSPTPNHCSTKTHGARGEHQWSYSTSSRVNTEIGGRSRVSRFGIQPSQGQLSLVIPPWVGENSTSDGYGYRRRRRR